MSDAIHPALPLFESIFREAAMPEATVKIEPGPYGDTLWLNELSAANNSMGHIVQKGENWLDVMMRHKIISSNRAIQFASVMGEILDQDSMFSVKAFMFAIDGMTGAIHMVMNLDYLTPEYMAKLEKAKPVLLDALKPEPDAPTPIRDEAVNKRTTRHQHPHRFRGPKRT